VNDPKEPPEQGSGGPPPDAEKPAEPPAAPTKMAPQQITEAIERMPPPVREMFEMMAVSTMAPHHPIIDKFKDEHVQQFLDNDRIETQNEYRLRSTNRWFYLAYFVLSLVALGTLFRFLLPGNKDLLVDLLKILLAFAAGVTGGFGLKTQLDKRKS
jgi:hypothetical protein